jgi:hypothetical protein
MHVTARELAMSALGKGNEEAIQRAEAINDEDQQTKRTALALNSLIEQYRRTSNAELHPQCSNQEASTCILPQKVVKLGQRREE